MVGNNMEDVATKKIELDGKLQKETANLSLLKENLQKSTQLTENMVSILTSLEDRLIRLEETIVPVYQETGNLQRRQENTDKVIAALDHVISFYHVAKEVGPVIRKGPNQQIDVFLSCMEKVQKAVTYFSIHQPGSPELATVNTLCEQGRTALENEFRVILTKHSKPVQPVIIMDLLEEQDEEKDDEQEAESKLLVEHLPEDATADLVKITKWLVSDNGKLDFLNNYAAVRSNILKRSLQGFRDHLKTQSGGPYTALVAQSPAPALVRGKSSTKDTPSKRGSSKKYQNFMRKASTLMKQTSHALEGGAYRKMSTLSVDFKEDDEIEIDGYINGLSALLKLIQSESQMMVSIIPEKYQRKIFDMLVQPTMDTVFNEGETIAYTAKKSIAKHEYATVLLLYPVVKHLRSIKPEFDIALEGCQAPTRAKLASLIAVLNGTGAKAMEDFIEDIRSDPDKTTNMPIDGTVHELSTNTVIFLQHLQDCAETAGAMLYVQDPNAMTHAQEPKKYAQKLAEYMTKVLSALGLNLSNKAQTYSDQTLGAVFMMNNYNYIIKSLERCALLDLIHSYNPDVKSYYDAQIVEQKRIYSQSFSRVMHYLLEVDKPISQQKAALQESQKLKDRDRQNIKDKFSGFNKELEDLYKVQKGYSIPDPELRKSLIQENKDYIITQYQVFYDKYQHMNFTKNLTKYIKYTVKEFEDLLEKFFDVAS